MEFTPHLDQILSEALRRGASYCDVRAHVHDYELITCENNVLKSYSSRRLSGVGIRVCIKGSTGYASTTCLDGSSLTKTGERAVKAAQSVDRKGSFSDCENEIERANLNVPIRKDPRDFSPEEKVSTVLEANKAALNSEEIKNVSTRLGIFRDLRLFRSSEGADISVETPLVGIDHVTVATVCGVTERVGSSKCACAGFEFIQSTDWNSFTQEVSESAREGARSQPIPSGLYTVVVDPDSVGLMVHEAFGHASEGDLVSTGESVLQHRLGTKVAHESVTIIDEGVIEGGYFCPYDDEGVEKGKTVVLEEGILKSYLHDRTSGGEAGVPSTGNGRAQNFECAPLVRQTNYYVQPGDYEVEELIEDIDFGVYITGKGGTGGQVDVGMGTFTFNTGLSHIIRHGEVAETVRGVVISGSVLDTLQNIDAVGTDFAMKIFAFSGCGKNGQVVKVGSGGPHIKINRVAVGGR